jgi:hypothetical protein
MNIFKATQDFEQWLATQLPLVRKDIALKHALMAEAPFPFFWSDLLPMAATMARGVWRSGQGARLTGRGRPAHRTSGLGATRKAG